MLDVKTERSVRCRIIEAESRVYELTMARNRVIDTLTPWDIIGSDKTKYEAAMRIANDLDVQIDKAEGDIAVWQAVIGSV